MAKNHEKKNESDVTEKVLYVNRCAKVVKGGRKFSFSALVLVGDGNGRIGYGFAKANELSDAIKKAGEDGRKAMFTVTKHGTTIPHEVQIKWDGALILLKPASAGTGVIAGSYIRSILEMAGVEDVMAKSIGSNNPMNQVHATFEALKQLNSREQIAETRGAS